MQDLNLGVYHLYDHNFLVFLYNIHQSEHCLRVDVVDLQNPCNWHWTINHLFEHHFWVLWCGDTYWFFLQSLPKVIPIPESHYSSTLSITIGLQYAENVYVCIFWSGRLIWLSYIWHFCRLGYCNSSSLIVCDWLSITNTHASVFTLFGHLW